ncbi:polyphosphate kinase 1 [Burkholderia cenocepacia]|uniref:Polyphosphate kinase n=4 Tax=Burkholderia cepacia complex TaxID=87882 RepID=PPK1_BURO0|nr:MULTISPECIES: polyphosphate kinase 1 [Burkholderia]A0K6D2.1 RecName: Full=Polyphosphate kinase; AltName: Full=ATP-polyphosphate phosphotransferase; AltName: Full=Polyphosphoric acid kinase [Burkholderia cenocepacia HI2424]B1JZG0.1 RecName: Full=Polyphosphate kinase; AltName: Full=ATP-polyphosphate phosphotransferase; AltName: Full=Polyphosphoric acid kinase [Burkholderia orbicola MC0-3]EAY62241.1 Polyphosphate kinase [Burkholderia cenocepacia PC184]EKS9844560.1 polyphosphate kinase 1 [Burkho
MSVRYPLLNRELGILGFNERVLAQAADPQVPLLERLRFICITSSNLDEFFEVRMAGLQEQIRDNPGALTPDGMSLQHAYDLVVERAQRLVHRQYTMLHETVLPALEQEGIYFHASDSWNDEQLEWARRYFLDELLPVLTPIGLDPAHPFPRVLNKSLNFVVELEGRDAFGRQAVMGIVQAPRALPRVVRMPHALSGFEHGFVLLSSFMQRFVGELFPQLVVKSCNQFRITRNSELFVDEDEITNLRVALQGELPARHLGNAVRLEVSADTPLHIVRRLLEESELGDKDCYRVAGSVNLVRLMQIPDLVDRPDLKFTPFTASTPAVIANAPTMFDAIDAGDILLHHPYESFQPVLELLQQAARDPSVVAIKQTIYRTGTDSPLMDALMEAARNGKEVTVVVELLARFDEETNINWASQLEAVGAHVVYGVVGHKCHAKMMLIVRRVVQAGKASLRRYVHLGTGNYHPRTARLYTDFGLMTADQKICEDVHHVFQQLTGIGGELTLHELWQSPFTLHPRIIESIRAEIDNAQAGKRARIVAKMNALLEPSVIAALYEASQAGVKVDLIVRGVCALKPGVPGLSENITVRSIVGRFLEHHRIYYFHAGGAEDVYLSSADWMDRNLFRRVEVAFPIRERKLKRRVIAEGLSVCLGDNQSAWQMHSDGHYRRRRTGKTIRNAQLGLLAKFCS